MTNSSPAQRPSSDSTKVRLAYVVSHPIQYQAPLLRRIALEPDIELTVLFGSDFSVRGYKDSGFGVEVAWDVPLLQGYNSEVLPAVRDTGQVSPFAPISRGIYRRLQLADGSAAFDAVWIHGYASINSLHTILAANALGIPVLLRAESWLADRTRSTWKLAAKRLFFRMLRSGISAVLPIGTVNAEYWHHYFGAGMPHFLMPYAVDNACFAQLTEAAGDRVQQLRSEFRLNASRPVILFASKLQHRKHADHLLEAYRRFISTAPESEQPYLIIVGDGEQRQSLELRAHELRLTGVHFTGFRNQSELPAFFRLAEVFVLPSKHEPWGLIVNEAMACGCAVIVSSDVGCHPDLVTDGIEGCIFQVGDVPALADALRRVFATPDTAARMGIAARQRISSWNFEEDVRGLRAALATTTGKLKNGQAF